MAAKRELLQPGYQLVLGDTIYTIKELEGCGNSSVVYRAEYEDNLISESHHEVLIKELFPWNARGLVYRDASGDICCKDEGRKLFEYHRKSFYSGNRVNLMLLKRNQNQVAGNLNSFEAHGTYYSVLTLHGGRNLAEMIGRDGQLASLEEMTDCIIHIVEAVKAFHGSGFLHLDISPDNILMMKDRAILIDYNSAWPIMRREGDVFPYSFKEGYTAPEVRLREGNSIGIPADIYSICAILFHMLTGRRLESRDTRGKGLIKALPKSLDAFTGVAVSAICQTLAILRKGLHGLPEKRFQNTEELLLELVELKNRILGRGVTKSALWEGSRRLYLKKSRDEVYRERSILIGEMSLKSEDFFQKELNKRENFILTGAGGIGKTSFLKNEWRKSVSAYRSDAPVVFYISLEQYQEAGQEPYFIRKRILEQVTVGERDQDTAMVQLERELGADRGKTSWIFLLDGLNEAGSKRELLLKEIEYLAKLPGTEILVTDRTGEVRKYALSDFEVATLLPFSEDEVAAYLEEEGLPCPEDAAFRELIGNPMILSLYRKVSFMKRERIGQEQQEEKLPGNVNEIIGEFLLELVVKAQRIYAGDEAQQLRVAYAVWHLLPAVAGEMKKRQRTFLNLQELTALLERDYRQITSAIFSKAFPEYIGKSRKMFKGVGDGREWLDCAVRDILTEQMNLLERTDSGGVRLIHENFSGYLIEKNSENRKKINQAGAQNRLRAGIALTAALCVLGIIGMLLFQSRKFPSSREETWLVENAFSCLMKNMRILDGQLSAQEEILDSASKDSVLSGESLACEQLIQSAEYALDNTELYMKSAGGGEAYIEELYRLSGNTIPLNTLQMLYIEPEKQQKVMGGQISHLLNGICRDDAYNTRTRKEELIGAYREYLEAYEICLYLEYRQVVLSVPKEYRQDIELLMTETTCFSKYMVKQEYVDISEEEFETMMGAAENRLWNAKIGMLSQNYPFLD